MYPHEGHWLNQTRLKVYVRTTAILFAAITVVIFVRWAMGAPNARLTFTDFSVYWVASYLALHGQALSVFDPASFCGNFQALVPASPCGYPWLYPPTFYLLILPLALMPYWAAYVGFIGGSVVAFGVMMRRLVRGEIALWCLAAFPGLWINVLSGQNGCLTAALAGAALLNLERRPALAGVFIGMLSIKPHLALLFPVALIAAGAWRAFLVAAGVALAWMAAGVLILGTGMLNGWLESLGIARALLERTEIVRMMPTVFAFMRLSGTSVMAAYVGQAVVAMIALFSVGAIWDRPVSSPLKYSALITGTLLVSPYLLEYDLAWLALPIAWMANQGIRTGWLRWEREILIAAWLTPVFCIALAKVYSLQLGAGVLLALLWIIVRRASAESRGKARHV